MGSLGYQGQYTDPSTGDTDMSARWYAPSTSTFTSSDTTPAGMPDPSAISGTPYGYVDGDPLTNVDPTGHWCVLCDIENWGEDVGQAVGDGFDDAVSACAADPICDIGAEEIGDGGFLDPWTLGLGVLAIAGGIGYYEFTSGSSSSSGSRSSSSSSSASDQNWAYQEYQWALENGGCTWCGYPSGSPSGGNPSPSYGYYPGYGYGGGYGGYYAYAPPPPPPPPPPPQDCYAVQTCTPPPAPSSLRNDEHITVHPSETTSLKDVSAKNTINQPTPTEQQLLQALGDDTDGLNPSVNENGSNAASQGSSTGQNTAGNDPAQNLGQPATPQATGPQANSPQASNPVAAGSTVVSPSASRNGNQRKNFTVQRANAAKAKGSIINAQLAQQGIYGGSGGAGGGNGLPTAAGCSEFPTGENLIPENPVSAFEPSGPQEISGVSQAVAGVLDGGGPAHTTAVVGVSGPVASPTPGPGIVDPLSNVAFALGLGFTLGKQWWNNRKNKNNGPGCPD
jgi:RHS repeat-associated protein